MRRAEEVGFALFLVIVFTMFVVLGWGYARRPRIVPLALSIPGLALSVLYLGRSLARLKRPAAAEDRIAREASGAKPPEGRPASAGEGLKIIKVWVWIIALAVAVNFLGFMIALPLFLLAFIRFFARRTWQLSALIAAAFTLAVYLVFYVGLKTTL